MLAVVPGLIWPDVLVEIEVVAAVPSRWAGRAATDTGGRRRERAGESGE
jgi:hypothetical protein